jgi:hypothetical protein
MALAKGEMWRTDCIGEGTFSHVVRSKSCVRGFLDGMMTVHHAG